MLLVQPTWHITHAWDHITGCVSKIDIIGSFTKIRTSSRSIRIDLVGTSIKIPLKWGVNQFCRVRNKEVMAFKFCKKGPIFNTVSVPKTVTLYWQFVCTDLAFEPNFSHSGTFYKKSVSTLWYLTVTIWNIVCQRIDNFFQIVAFVHFEVKNC